MVYSDKQQKTSGGIIVQEEAPKNSDENVDDDIDIEAIWSSQNVVAPNHATKTARTLNVYCVYTLDWLSVVC